MKSNLMIVITAIASSFGSIHAAESMGGELKILSPATNNEIKTARIGQKIKVAVRIKNLNLIANKNAEFNYAISVLPTGSNTPISISGKLAGRATLPANDGGKNKTKSELASWAGVKTANELIEIPDFLPPGKATLTVSLTGAGVGAISFSKSLVIKL